MGRQLAAHEVQGLHAVGALIDHGDAGIAHILLHAVVADVAVPAIDLHPHGSGHEAHVGEHGLHDGRHQRREVLGPLALLGIVRPLHEVEVAGHPAGQSAATFVVGPHGHEGAAHIRMHQDGVGRLLGIFRPGQRAALQALAGIGDGGLIGRFPEPQALGAHGQALRVHHGEHGAHALVGLAHQPAGGVLEGHLAGGGPVNAHLVLDAGAQHAVARAEGAVLLGQELGHQEERDALDALGRVRQAGEHQVDDVLRHVLLAGGDEDLVAGDLVGAVRLGHRLGADEAEIGAALGLGEAHGAGPGAFHHLGQEAVLQFVGGVVFQRHIGAVGEAGADAEGEVRRAHHLLDELGHARREALAAIFGIAGDAVPAAFGIGGIGLLEALGGAHHAVLVGAALLVARLVEGRENLGDQLAGLVEHGVDEVGGDLLHALHVFQLLGPVQLMEDEAHVAQRRGVDLHDVGSLCLWSCRHSRRPCGRERGDPLPLAGEGRGLAARATPKCYP